MKTPPFYFSICFFCFWISLAWISYSQNVPYLVKDINVGTGSSIRHTGATNNTMSALEVSRNFCVFKERLYFFAFDGTKIALWRSDGTRQGTAIFASFNYATTVSADEFGGMVATDKFLYFFANTTATGTELWRTDGTEAGTMMVADLNRGTGSGINSSSYQGIVGPADMLYFTARSSGSGTANEIWRTDGTTTGTVSLRPRIGTANPSAVGALMRFKNQLFFTATFNTTGSELWVSDGTEQNTRLFKEFGAGNVSGPNFLGQYNLGTIATDKYLYMLDTRRLYRTDGTPDSTVLVREISPNSDVFAANWPPGLPQGLSKVDETLYFIASVRSSGTTTAPVGTLWRSDGTAAGTIPVSNVSNERPERLFSLKNSFLVLGNLARMQATQPLQRGLWAASPTQAIPSLLSSEVGRPLDIGADNPALIHNNNALFVAQGPRQDFYVWRSDGTATGTDTLFSLPPATAIYLCGMINDRLLYYANSTNPNVGWELFAAPVSINPTNCEVKVKINASTTRLACNGETALLTATPTGGNAPFVYRWKRGDSTFTPTTNVLAVSRPGNYSVTLIDGRGCTTTDTLLITQPEMPTLRIAGNLSVCRNVGTTLTAVVSGGKAPFQYQWQLASNVLSPTTSSLNVTQGGRYQLNLTDSEGCKVSALADVSEDNVRVNMVGSLAFCTGTNTTLRAEVLGAVLPLTYQWRRATNILSETTNTLTTSTAGSYVVEVKDGRGCIGTSPTTEVVELPLPPAIITSDKTQITSGEMATLTANSGTALSYQWQQERRNIPMATSATYTTSLPGVYRVLVTRNGCISTSDEVTIALVTSTTSMGLPKQEGLQVAPNPVGDWCLVRLQLSTAAKVMFVLTDIQGRVLQEWHYLASSKGHELWVDFTQKPAGTYFINAYVEEKHWGETIVKPH
ncbi:MAG: hypothetical protein ACK4GN_11585 [Runella sp.]